jgi:hypothetical protein
MIGELGGKAIFLCPTGQNFAHGANLLLNWLSSNFANNNPVFAFNVDRAAKGEILASRANLIN